LSDIRRLPQIHACLFWSIVSVAQRITTDVRLTIEIQRSLDFYERHFSQAAIAGIVLTPVPGLTAEVCQYLQAQLGVPTRWLDMATEAAVDGEMDGEALLHCTPVIGASLREDRVEF
jgi:MSHA biogenesis protein MshI